jgi:glutathione S-transferase
MTIKIYGHAGAICTKRVIITLNELGLSYELVPVNLLAGEHKQEGFLAKQPFGKIPYVEDDGNGQGPTVGLFESRAICRYLATRYGGENAKLLPSAKDLEAYARFEEV